VVDIRIKDLPLATGGTVTVPSDNVAIDGAITRKTTVQTIVDVGAPVASQAEAEAGINNSKRMTPLTTAQAIEAQALTGPDIGVSVQPYSTSLATLSGVTPGSAGVSMLALSLNADVRSFLTVAPYVTSRTNLKALDTTKDKVAILTEDGREGIFKWAAGDFSTQITTDTFEGVYIKATAIASSAGAWVRFNDGYLNILWFGATKATVAQLQSTSLFNAVPDSADNVAGAYAVAAMLGATVVGMGTYKTTKMHDIPSGITVQGLGALEAWETPFFDVPAMTMDRGLTFIMTGNGSRNCTLSYCSNMRYGGAFRTNVSRLYTTSNDNYFEATDFTNANSSGSTPATPKPFSAMVRTGNDGLSGKVALLNTRWVPRCDDGANGPLSGYLAVNANSVVAWDEWDVGLYQMNPYTAIVEDCQFVGNINVKGLVQTSIRFGNTTAGGRGEMAIYQRNFFSNGIAIRNGDFFFPTAKTASTVTIPVGEGHMIPTSGSIFANSASLAFTSTTSGAGTLTLNGIADTSGITVGGLDATIIHMTNNNGTTQTVFRDNNIRDFYHTSGLERPNPLFGAQASKYSAAIELVGYPIRGISFENNTIYTKEPLFLLQMGARNVFWKQGTYEEKDYRTSLGGALNPSGEPMGLAIVGPDTASAGSWNALPRGDNTLFGYPWSGRTNIGPVGIVPGGCRYSSFNDCYGGYRYSAIGEPTTDQPIIYDIRLPRTYTPTGTSDVDASLTVYDEVCLVNHSGSPNPVILVTLKAPWYVKRVRLKQLNATNDLELKQGTAAEQFSLGGNNLRMFSSLQDVVLVRNNAQSAWTIEGNYGTNGTFANVTTTGGIVTGGT
jgi:cell wall-associated NlpC family hydrolase